MLNLREIGELAVLNLREIEKSLIFAFVIACRIMEKRVFKRKIYDRILQWKQESNGESALMIQGARRIGKSTIAEEFAKNEYSSYLIIDFNKASSVVKALFDDLMNLDIIFLQLQTIYNVVLEERKSEIGRAHV